MSRISHDILYSKAHLFQVIDRLRRVHEVGLVYRFVSFAD